VAVEPGDEFRSQVSELLDGRIVERNRKIEERTLTQDALAVWVRDAT